MSNLSQTLETLKERIEVLRDILQMNPNNPKVKVLLVRVYYALVALEKPLNTQRTPKLYQILGEILRILLPKVEREETGGIFLEDDERKELLEHSEAILTVKDWAGKPFA